MGEGNGVYDIFQSGRYGEGKAGYVGVVKEEGAVVGEVDILTYVVFVLGGVGGEGKHLVVVWSTGALWYGDR